MATWSGIAPSFTLPTGTTGAYRLTLKVCAANTGGTYTGITSSTGAVPLADIDGISSISATAVGNNGSGVFISIHDFVVTGHSDDDLTDSESQMSALTQSQ